MSIADLESILELADNIDFNEADTRFHLIDELFIRVLGWPRSQFKLEVSTINGYSDYHLLRPDGKIALIIEAKRSGISFDLPANFNQGKKFRAVKVRALLSCKSLSEALIQAQRYCSDEGCEYGAIANGRQIVIFKAFEKGKPWKELTAMVISDLSWMKEEYNKALSLLGYTSVVQKYSLRHAFENSHPDGREVFFPKERISSFNQIVNANTLAGVLRPIVNKYFGPIDVADREFVDKCYVNKRAYDEGLQGIRNLIRDSVSPFMENYRISETEDSENGGAFASRLARNVRSSSVSNVMVLFGSKGAGKSTFIRKVLLHNPPQYLKKHSFPVIVDLLSAPKEATAIRERLWEDLIGKLDCDNKLLADREDLLDLFSDKYEVALKQDLKGLPQESESYIKTLNNLIGAWKADLRYVAKRLVAWHRRNHRGVIVAVDNTDQLENELQDYAFSLASEISNDLQCVVLLTMREERFYASKIRGMLDAYQVNSFHISSPAPQNVFRRRVEYVLDLIKQGKVDLDAQDLADVDKFFNVFRSDFGRHPVSPLNQFISASAHGNIRLALELFGDLILSGYTNASEMISAVPTWKIQIHQVIRPILTPTRLFYDEKISKIPNMFQIRFPEGGSHFTGLRILKRLSLRQDPGAPAYQPLGEIRSYFSEIFGSDEDFKVWLDRLLASNIVEASTRQDYFSEDIDQVRITSFGQFILSDLYKYFTYVELASTDCGVRSESVCNDLVSLSNKEYYLLGEGRRYERVERRVDKADVFIKYLEEEESREVDFYSLSNDYRLVPDLQEAWEREKIQVLQSAKRNK
ncbi:hypothetical protein [Ectopseudomonas mendocina]|uniref:hypothetical protein n=1 Tax=Ectopseudomonas mendocina TaxID=300 RepID=UPI003F0FA734